jgi:hypothetical protein
MKLVKKLKIKWYVKPKKWEMFCGLGALAVFTLTYLLPIAEGDDVLYLLSATSQGLAAIFTLVFAITIFGAQMMRKFTAIDDLINKWTKILMIAFTIGIILPLIQLKTDKDILNISSVSTANLSLAIDLGLATFCILAIIPYLIWVNRIVKYKGGVSKLSEEAAEAIDSDYRATASHRIDELAELGKGAVKEELKNETNDIISKLKKLGKDVVDKEWADVTDSVLMHLKQIGLAAAERKLDGSSGFEPAFSATYAALEALGEVGCRAAEKGLVTTYGFPVVDSAISGLREISLKAMDSDLSDTTASKSCYYLLKLGVEIVKSAREDERLIASLMRSQPLPNVNLRVDESRIVESLKELAIRAHEKGCEYLFDWDEVYSAIGSTGSEWKDIPDAEKIKEYLKEHVGGVDWIENARITKSADTITISDNNNAISFNFREKKLTYYDNYIIFDVKEENGKQKICTYRFEKTLKCALRNLWVLSAYTCKYFPKYVTNMANYLSHSFETPLRELFENEREAARNRIKKSEELNTEKKERDDLLRSLDDFYEKYAQKNS